MRIILIAATFASLACESTYHPEYHPVTVTTVHQAWSGGAPVVVTPAPPAQPIVIEQPTLADPQVVFGR